jgi:pimeloyl-ACP methyl ester carboxylesterase
VVLLHGGGQTRHSWGSTAADLGAKNWYAVTVDLRGHGDSSWSQDRYYGLDRFANDVAGVADFLGRPPVYVGASLGGNSSLAAIGVRPDLALGLVLVDVSPFLQPAGTSRIRDFMVSHAEVGFGTLEEAADAVAAYVPHRPRPRNLDGLKKNLRFRDGRWYWHWDPAFLTAPNDDPFVRVERLEQAAIDLTIPILLIRGKLSDVVSAEGVQDFLAKVPAAEFVELADAGHTAAGDDNDAFSEAVVSFVTR